MIYVSSSCSDKKDIRESVLDLVNCKIKNIELSGGTEFFHTIVEDLKELQAKYNLNYLLHNYFPPPQEHFVLNLASSNSEIRRISIEHIKNALNISEYLGGKKFAFHAGFFINPSIRELGKKIGRRQVYNRKEGEKYFIDSFLLLKPFENRVKLYVENNVLSESNFKNFGNNPFMLTNTSSYNKLQQKIEFNLLLDVAHLKVSSNSLGLNFREELLYLSETTDYLHLSDNDGYSDLNLAVEKDSEMFNLLQICDLKNKTITLEIYSGLRNVIKTIELMTPLVD